MEKSKITTLKDLKKVNYQPRSIQEELAKNLREKIKKGETTFEGLIGYENTVIPDLERAILSLSQTEILRFADFGAADGGTSQELWFNLINLLRSRGDNRAIEIIYTDLASNDFSTLFKTMQGMHGEKDIAYQQIFDNVFVHGCGTGFHRQLLASGSLSLGLSLIHI